MRERGLIANYQERGQVYTWSAGGGGERRLFVLGRLGQAWYAQVFGSKPVESELIATARRYLQRSRSLAVY